MEKTSKKKTVLVTGAGGALAQQVIRSLVPNHQVIAVDFRRRVKVLEGLSGYKIPSYHVEYNKRAFEDVFRQHTIDAVVHLGRMGLYEYDHKRRYNANVLGTQKLLDLCLKYEVNQVVVLSTYFVYGASPYNPALLTEDYPLKASELTMDLVDSVELENLASIYLFKYPNLHITTLRPCNIVGSGVLNSMSLLLLRKVAPVLLGFSPMMQFVHIDDMKDAILVALKKNKPGIYNVAPDDWVSYQSALKASDCVRLPIPSAPLFLARSIMESLNLKAFPSYLMNYYKYPVILDGSLFRETFDFKFKKNLKDIFCYYQQQKKVQKT